MGTPSKPRPRIAYDPASPAKSQLAVRDEPPAGWRERMRAELARRIERNHARDRASILREIARIATGVAAPAVIVVALVLVAPWLLQRTGRGSPRSLLLYAPLLALVIAARIRDLRAERRDRLRLRRSLLAHQLEVGAVLADLAAFEAAARALVAIEPASALGRGAAAFVHAAHGRRAEARALLGEAPAHDRWSALAQLVLAALDNDPVAIARCSEIASPLLKGSPLVLQRLLFTLGRAQPALFRSAQHGSAPERDEFDPWMRSFVPALASARSTSGPSAHPWFTPPAATQLVELPRREPLSVLLSSPTAWMSATFVTAALSMDLWRRHRSIAAYTMTSVAIAAAAFRQSQRRAFARLCATAIDAPIDRWTSWLSTHAWSALDRSIALTRLACRALLAERTDEALSLARRLSVTAAREPDLAPFVSVSLWIAGLSGDAAATESLLAAIERRAPRCAERIAWRFEARLALALARADRPELELLARSAPEAVSDHSIGRWVVHRISPRDTPPDELEPWMDELGLRRLLEARLDAPNAV